VAHFLLVTTIRATVFQTPSSTEFQHLDDVVLTVADGRIESIAAASGHDGPIDVSLASDTVLVPGFIDLHLHAPQWPQLGTGYDVPLDEWLFEYTFPTESRCADTSYAQAVWDDMVPALLANGTTTAVYYGSTHVEATTALAETCVRHGQRAWVGRTAMDHPEGTPDYYRDDSPGAALEATRTSIREIEALDDPHGLVRPIITPRFIPACTDELLTGLGALAAETGHLVQTHCSENDWEHGYVLERHGVSDTTSLARFGLMRQGTVLGHGCLLSDDDFATISSLGAGVAHCPLSNLYFGDAVFPTRRALEAGVNVGLGTDIAGGPSASLLSQAARAVDVSRHLENGVDQRLDADDRGVSASRIDATTAFYLATLGGADVLGEPLGLLEVGRRFDAVAISMDAVDNLPGRDTPERRFEKLVRTAGRRDITDVWVDGAKVV
jgi:guanine deaminase